MASFNVIKIPGGRVSSPSQKTNVSLEISSSDLKDFEQQIRTAISKELFFTLSQLKDEFSKTIKDEFETRLKDSSIISDLEKSDDFIAMNMGFPVSQGPDKAKRIIDAILDSTTVKLSQKTKNKVIDFTISVLMQPDDYNNLTHLGDTTIISRDGRVYNWLGWMLHRGSKTLIREFGILESSEVSNVYNNPSTIEYIRQRIRHGKSGLAIMSKNAPSSYWRMPPRWQGSVDNNFITVASESMNWGLIQKQISKVVKRELKKVFRKYGV